jgi:hypothetical protein
MNDNQAIEQHLPAAPQPVRDDGGKFATGNPAAYGQPFTPGLSGNPTGLSHLYPILIRKGDGSPVDEPSLKNQSP